VGSSCLSTHHTIKTSKSEEVVCFIFSGLSNSTITMFHVYVPPRRKYDVCLPNVVIKWLTSLLHIQDITGSNLGPETRCPD
jgi:hypothetical protein